MANLFYLMGPSGSGKDSLLEGLRQRLNGGSPVLFAHRYITRHWKAGGENHIELSPQEFDQRLRSGLFKMHWQANGCHYGIGTEVDAWLASGHSVIANGSRASLAEAQRCFGAKLVPVLVGVEPHLLRRRLLARGRESAAEIEARVSRSLELQHQLQHQLQQQLPDRTLHLHNNGALSDAVTDLHHLLQQHVREAVSV
ncbi:ribose 1,5-bisphosphokinase [Aestuariirhabdus sp. Z084]|uniref:ribose 1,5-bisphosphokinase n=1 Tax=Aestuariirhabdus haliotis TaxID=2918751 RepID=UPI00201B417E|nr:ribose 1,5-bisphosphokinase [Aestuariirhabdus haliotis]MCL6416000.1 ribose 1,5-bisphosphokinase [Aestuariirhabdus haliotis]MCL6419967.1 ribose 1,5-bisphosphokinase [Aestuariirhabdus haliotis]